MCKRDFILLSDWYCQIQVLEVKNFSHKSYQAPRPPFCWGYSLGTRGGWKLVISSARRIAISATQWRNHTGCHSECEIDFHNGALTCSGQNSLSGYCQVSSRLPALILCYKWNIWAVPLNSSQTTMRAIVGDLELTWQYPLSEFVPNKRGRRALWKSISHFTMGLNGTLCDYVIHGSINCYPCTHH